MTEHHRGRPNLPYGVGDSLPCDIRRRAVHGLKHGWIFFFWIEVGGRGDADRSYDGGAQVGENIAKKIGAYNHVKPVWMAHEMSGQNIDVILIQPNVGILSGQSM